MLTTSLSVSPTVSPSAGSPEKTNGAPGPHLVEVWTDGLAGREEPECAQAGLGRLTQTAGLAHAGESSWFAHLRGMAKSETSLFAPGSRTHPEDHPGAGLAGCSEALGDQTQDPVSADLTEHTVLSVVGARGGIGTTCLVLHLAWAIRRIGHSVAVVDLDPVGCVGHILGRQLTGGLRWADLHEEETAYRSQALTHALPTWHQVPILTTDQRGGVPNPASQLAVIRALAGEHEVVLIDQLRTQPAHHGTWPLLVTGLDAVSVMAAQILAPELCRLTGHPLALAARGIGEDVDTEYLNWSMGAPVLGEIPQDRGVSQRVARGDDLTRTRGAATRAVLDLAQTVVETYLDVDGPGLGRALDLPQPEEGEPREEASW